MCTDYVWLFSSWHYLLQSGRFGKLNKRVSFPETLDLSPYMSEADDDGNVYKLYAVVVHVDMLNASYFGHYICYTKDFSGNWYRIDDCKVFFSLHFSLKYKHFCVDYVNNNTPDFSFLLPQSLWLLYTFL